MLVAVAWALFALGLSFQNIQKVGDWYTSYHVQMHYVIILDLNVIFLFIEERVNYNWSLSIAKVDFFRFVIFCIMAVIAFIHLLIKNTEILQKNADLIYIS